MLKKEEFYRIQGHYLQRGSKERKWQTWSEANTLKDAVAIKKSGEELKTRNEVNTFNKLRIVKVTETQEIIKC